MEKCDDIWEFIEKKLNCTIPTYIVNVLKACGYDNAITIGKIEEEDVQYFEKQVRDGNVSKYYEGIEATSIFAGSTKNEVNFEFTRGHKKFLLFISDFLKKYAKENASDPVTLPLKKLTENIKKKSVDLSPTCEFQNKNNDFRSTVTNRDINLHQGVLTSKIIMSLINTIPAMYAMNMESINKKIANDLVKVKVNGESIFEAVIYCPFCTTTTCAFHKSSENKFSWNVSYFEAHLENSHRDESEHIEAKTIMRPLEDQYHSSISAVEYSNDDTNFEQDGFLPNDRTHKDSFAVRLLDSSADNLKDLSYSEILKTPYVGKFEVEPEKMISTGTRNENSKCLPNNRTKSHVGTNDPLGRDNQSITPELGSFVICLLLVKDTIKWPSNTSTTKNFLGKICQRKKNVSNVEDIEPTDESFDIQLLIKKQNSNFIFYYPEQFETRRIPGSKIVKILPDPIVNRRGALVFKDKSILDYAF